MELKLKSQRRASQLEVSRMLADLTCGHGSKQKLFGGPPAPKQLQAFGHPSVLLRLLNRPASPTSPAQPSPAKLTSQCRMGGEDR